jgi:hypothetical protein
MSSDPTGVGVYCAISRRTGLLKRYNLKHGLNF